MSETSGIGAVELVKECKACLDGFTGNPVDYPETVKSLLAKFDGMVLLTVISGNKVCLVNSVGRFICGLGKHPP